MANITKTDVTDFVATLSHSLADSEESSRIFDELMIVLGHDGRGWFSNFGATATGTQSDSTDADAYELVTSSGTEYIRLLALFWAGRELILETRMTLAAENPEWRDTTGEPFAYVLEEENDRIVRPFPKITQTTTGTDIADQSISPVAIFTEARTATIPDYFKLPLALLILAVELSRESNHRDTSAAEICQALGTQLLGFITP